MYYIHLKQPRLFIRNNQIPWKRESNLVAWILFHFISLHHLVSFNFASFHFIPFHRKFKHFDSFKHEIGQTLRSLWVFEIFFFLHQPYSLISLHVHVCFFPLYLTGIVSVRSLQLHNSFLQIVGHESATDHSSPPRIFSLHFTACFVRKYAEQPSPSCRNVGSSVHAAGVVVGFTAVGSLLGDRVLHLRLQNRGQ